MEAAAEVILQDGDILYREGDKNDCGYIIEEGEILLHTLVDGTRIDVERRGPGAIVGELSILTGKPRTVTVEAVTPVRAFRVSAAQIVALFENLDPILRACIETSITFNATLIQKDQDRGKSASLVPSTLRNADHVIETFRFENDLISGMKHRQFHMVYQPIVRLSDHAVAGVEALTRWTHPVRGLVPPDQFITAAERMGAISEITDFAIMEACAALRDVSGVPNTPADFFMSVNISGQDLGRREFVDFLAHALDLHDLAPQQLKLEVTETALIDDKEIADRTLQGLRQLGCGISVDDFGTGYSNLGYLKSLPLTALKIDRAFAGDAARNSVSKGIVRLLIALGKELDVHIIAEGLETTADVETLSGLGCAYAQGYFFHRPMPLPDLLEVIGLRGKNGSRVA